MKVYKTEYYTFSKGRDAQAKPGNLRQFSEVAYIQCHNTAQVEVLLEKFYKEPLESGDFYQPVIERITFVEGHCIITAPSGDSHE